MLITSLSLERAMVRNVGPKEAKDSVRVKKSAAVSGVIARIDTAWPRLYCGARPCQVCSQEEALFGREAPLARPVIIDSFLTPRNCKEAIGAPSETGQSQS